MAYVDVYTTVAGDMWDLISKKVFGDEKYMSDLMEANPDLASVLIFDGGVELVVPDVEISEASTLPPWKREN
jgi:phage tail protein X